MWSGDNGIAEENWMEDEEVVWECLTDVGSRGRFVGFGCIIEIPVRW